MNGNGEWTVGLEYIVSRYKNTLKSLIIKGLVYTFYSELLDLVFSPTKVALCFWYQYVDIHSQSVIGSQCSSAPQWLVHYQRPSDAQGKHIPQQFIWETNTAQNNPRKFIFKETHIKLHRWKGLILDIYFSEFVLRCGLKRENHIIC